MKTLIIFSPSSTFRPLSVISSLASDLRKEGLNPTVLDVGDYSAVKQGLPPRWFARLLGHDVFPDMFSSLLAANDVGYTKLSRLKTRDRRHLPREVKEEFEDAIASDLATYLRTDAPNTKSLFFKVTRKKIVLASETLYWRMRDFLDQQSFGTVFIPNGRVPEQRLAWLAALDSGNQVEFYEIGRATEHAYYRGKTQVHDRINSQNEVLRTTSHLSEKEVNQLASQWLATRLGPGLDIHPYGKKWKQVSEAPVSKKSNRLSAVFFSSSVDEFASYGDSWNSHSWIDQYQAFASIIRILEKKDIDLTLRVHPNLLNKASSYVRRENKRLWDLKEEFPQLKIIPPTSNTNSYDLLAAADYIFVGRSTLGLEGSCLGKSVWTTTAARYDEIADVRKIHHPEDLNEQALSPWTVDPSKANRFVAYWVIQDYPFRYGEDSWSTWDSMNAPYLLRLGNLLSKNSLFHKWHLLRLVVSKWRNGLRRYPC